MPGYVYGGTDFYVEPPAKRVGVFDPTACGSPRGYKQHRRHREDACQSCLDANAADMAKKRRQAETPKFNPDKCGTTAGYWQHQNYGVPLCDRCRQANADDCKARRDAKKQLN
jgi:hypothetical protein